MLSLHWKLCVHWKEFNYCFRVSCSQLTRTSLYKCSASICSIYIVLAVVERWVHNWVQWGERQIEELATYIIKFCKFWISELITQTIQRDQSYHKMTCSQVATCRDTLIYTILHIANYRLYILIIRGYCSCVLLCCTD